jgi:hypothetical protein
MCAVRLEAPVPRAGLNLDLNAGCEACAAGAGVIGAPECCGVGAVCAWGSVGMGA